MSSASEAVVDSFGRVWLVLARKLESHFGKFHIECRQLASHKPLLLQNDSAKYSDELKQLHDY